MPAPAESVTGAWAVPAAAGASPYGGGSPYAGAQPPRRAGPPTALTSLPRRAAGRTRWSWAPATRGTKKRAPATRAAGGLAARLGLRRTAARRGRRRRARRGGATRRLGKREPFLQRWLFSSRLVYVLVGAVLLVGLAGGGWYLTSGRYTSVPAVGKLTATQAAQTLRQAGFQVRTGPPVIDDNVPKGEVISTSPSGRALPGATIVLTISQGPRMITVPPIPAGDTVAQAMAAAAQGRADRGLEAPAGRRARATRSSARWRAPPRRRAPPGRRTSRSR